MMRLGIMQGRLLPPVGDRIQAFPGDRWADEFPFAADADLDCLEWIYDLESDSTNPLATPDGIARVKDVSRRHRVGVFSVCADYFMAKPLVRATDAERRERTGKLVWLLSQCHEVGIERVVLPFVDQSAIVTAEDEADVIAAIEFALPAASRVGIELHLETSLAPAPFRDLLARLPYEIVKVNYDSGNSASLGYRVGDEFAAYGDRIGSVHIKDRVRGAGTVPLGSGDADLDAVFDGLRSLGYQGDLILQVARGEIGDEVAWAKRNRSFVASRWGVAV